MLKDLKVEHIQRFYNKMYNRGNGASTSTIRKIHVILKSALNQAVTNELLFKNPANGVELPEHKQKEIKVFSLEEQSSFCEKAKEYRLYPAFIVNLDTGLRLGEILALKWNDIDLTRGIISVNKNLVMIKDRNEKSKNNYKLFEQDTTKKSSRKSKY